MMSQLNKSASKRWNQTGTRLGKIGTGLGSDLRLRNPVEMAKTRFVQGIFTQNAGYLLIQQVTYHPFIHIGDLEISLSHL